VPDELAGAIRGRRVWTGTISFGLVSVPVDLLPAQRPGPPGLRMLAPDGTPLSRQYHDPDTGAEVTSDQIIRGYELDEGGWVTVENDELSDLAPEKSRDIDLRVFVPQEQIDPIYFERAYFLTPSGDSRKAYRLLTRVMEAGRRVGIASFVMRGREYLIALLADGGVLRAETMRFHDEIRPVSEIDLPDRPPDDGSLVKRLKKVVRANSSDTLDMALLEDEEAERLEDLVRGKVDAGDVVASEVEQAGGGDEDTSDGDVIDLLEVIRRSLAEQVPDEEARPLSDLTRDELYERAQELDIPGRSSMRKAELVEAVRGRA